jgi:acyl-coenzyme A thioesterase PaaI-like protein
MTEPEEHELTFPDVGCFGCSPTRPDGLQIRFKRRGDVVVSEYAIPGAYHGPVGSAHGGIVATLFDEISCAAAAWVFEWFVVTGELTVRYLRPVPVETPLHWEARVTSSAHERYLVVDATVQQNGEPLAQSTSKIFRQGSAKLPS